MRVLTRAGALMWCRRGAAVTSDLTALVTEGRIVEKALLSKTDDLVSWGQGGTVKVCSFLMPCSHSVQHLHAS